MKRLFGVSRTNGCAGSGCTIGKHAISSYITKVFLSPTPSIAAVAGGRFPVTPKEVLAQIRAKEVRAVDLRFMDFPGLWQHFTIPQDALDEAVFEEGLGFDGSSIRGWQAINESDMLVMPVPETAFLD